MAPSQTICLTELSDELTKECQFTLTDGTFLWDRVKNLLTAYSMGGSHLNTLPKEMLLKIIFQMYSSTFNVKCKKDMSASAFEQLINIIEKYPQSIIGVSFDDFAERDSCFKLFPKFISASKNNLLSLGFPTHYFSEEEISIILQALKSNSSITEFIVPYLCPSLLKILSRREIFIEYFYIRDMSWDCNNSKLWTNFFQKHGKSLKRIEFDYINYSYSNFMSILKTELKNCCSLSHFKFNLNTNSWFESTLGSIPELKSLSIIYNKLFSSSDFEIICTSIAKIKNLQELTVKEYQTFDNSNFEYLFVFLKNRETKITKLEIIPSFNSSFLPSFYSLLSCQSKTKITEFHINLKFDCFFAVIKEITKLETNIRILKITIESIEMLKEFIEYLKSQYLMEYCNFADFKVDEISFPYIHEIKMKPTPDQTSINKV
jgi:hypothetical protein